MKTHPLCILHLALALILLIGCTPTPSPVASAPTATATQAITATALPPTETATPEPTATTIATPEPSATATAEPTATQTATPTAIPTETPVPVAPPAAPTSLEGMVEWLETVLATGADRAQAEQTLRDAGYLTNPTDWQRVDMNGDGNPEWLIRAVEPNPAFESPYGPGGMVFVAVPSDGRVQYQAGEDLDPFYRSPTLIDSASDVTGDGNPDPLFELTYCGANTCYQEYHAVSYQDSPTPRDLFRTEGLNSEGQLVNDLPFATISYSQTRLEDQTGDGILDVILAGGYQGSVGAGPQRGRAETYSWDGSALVLTATSYEETDFRYFKLLDANIAFEAQDYATATTLYREARDSTTLLPTGWPQDDERETSAAQKYAATRLVLIALLSGDVSQARTEAAALQQLFPTSDFNALVETMITTYDQTQDITQVCAAARAAIPYASLTAPLDYMGYSNPELTPPTLCPL